MSHVYEAKKDLVKYVHRFTILCVRLEDALNSGFIVYHNSESCFVVEVKSKQTLDQSLMKLKGSVFIKLNESFFLGR